MPAVVTLTLALPSELSDAPQLLAELRERIAAAEAAVAAERLRTGGRVVGRRAILGQSWRDCPASRAPRRNLRPRIAACNPWARLEAIRRNREFLTAYRDARACWIDGHAIPFPVGTYWLRRFAHVPLTS